MCTKIWDVEQGIVIETQGQLADYLDVSLSDLPIDEVYPETARQSHVCLCPVNVESALKAAGRPWKSEHGDIVVGKA